MKIDEFLSEFEIPEGKYAAEESKTKFPDTITLNANVVSSEGDICVVEVNGVFYEIEKADIANIETVERPVQTGFGSGRPAAIMLKKEACIYSRTKIKVADLISGALFGGSLSWTMR
jgi:hypothetical protein